MWIIYLTEKGEERSKKEGRNEFLKVWGEGETYLREGEEKKISLVKLVDSFTHFFPFYPDVQATSGKENICPQRFPERQKLVPRQT